MRSRYDEKAVRELRGLSDAAKGELMHVFNNGFMIVRGTAEQLNEHQDVNVKARGRTIVRTIDEMVRLEREMLFGD